MNSRPLPIHYICIFFLYSELITVKMLKGIVQNNAETPKNVLHPWICYEYPWLYKNKFNFTFKFVLLINCANAQLIKKTIGAFAGFHVKINTVPVHQTKMHLINQRSYMYLNLHTYEFKLLGFIRSIYSSSQCQQL